MSVETLFLDAGGVLVFPNWTRVSDALARHGVQVDAARLAAADPRAKRRLDVGDTVAATTMHVGDLYHVDVMGARAAGIRAVLLDAAGLYEGYDCARVRALDELADLVAEDAVRPA